MNHYPIPTLQQNTLMADILQQMNQQSDLKKLSTKLANRLIKEEQIQPIGDLHYFLECDKACSNHTAVRLWVTENMDQIDTNDCDIAYEIIRDKFLNLMREYI